MKEKNGDERKEGGRIIKEKSSQKERDKSNNFEVHRSEHSTSICSIFCQISREMSSAHPSSIHFEGRNGSSLHRVEARQMELTCLFPHSNDHRRDRCSTIFITESSTSIDNRREKKKNTSIFQVSNRCSSFTSQRDRQNCQMDGEKQWMELGLIKSSNRNFLIV